MSALQSSLGAKLQINGLLLMACLCGAIAWLSWPSSMKWWGMGVISILMGASAVSALIRAIKEMITLYGRDKSVAALMEQGVEAKADDIANDDVLRAKGMVDG